MRDRFDENRLRDETEWEEQGEIRSGIKASIVFSVRFNSGEFREVRLAAEEAGEKTSEFIRRAAMIRARSSAARMTGPVVVTVTPPPGGVVLFGGVADAQVTAAQGENKAA